MKAIAIVGFVHESIYHVEAVKIGEASSVSEARAKESKWWGEVHAKKRSKAGITDTGICNNFEGSEISANKIQLYED